MQHDMATTNNSYLLRINSAERTPIDPWLPRIQNNDEYLELGLTFAPPNSASCSSNTSNEQFEPIGDVGALRLADALQYNDHLQYLDLSRNGIGGIGGAALAKALYQYIKGASDQYVSRTALRSLNLSKNQIGDEGAEAFTQMLEYNTSLTRFDLSFNGISFKNVNQLLESLEKNSTVTAIYLTGNLKNVNARDMSHLVDSRRAILPSLDVFLSQGLKASDQSTIKARQLSSSTKKHLVINAVGIDRPGIVADVTKIVTSNGGNCGESRAQLLGGHFSLMMLVDIPETGIDGLKKQLESDVGGLSTGCFDAVDPKAVDVNPKIGFVGHFKLSGADNPGIVHKLTSVLAKNSLTIAYMKTRQDEAPFGGTELFTMEGRAVAYQPLASHFDHKKIGEELQELGDSLNCDVVFSDMTGSSL
ncbi:hypothetical protein ACHAXN_009773 [Cyclotella atomus]